MKFVLEMTPSLVGISAVAMNFLRTRRCLDFQMHDQNSSLILIVELSFLVGRIVSLNFVMFLYKIQDSVDK